MRFHRVRPCERFAVSHRNALSGGDPCYQDDEKDLGLQYADEETLIKIITKRIKKFVNSREFNEKTFKEIIDYLRNY